MRMPEKCRNSNKHNNNNFDNPLTSCRIDGGKNKNTTFSEPTTCIAKPNVFSTSRGFVTQPEILPFRTWAGS